MTKKTHDFIEKLKAAAFPVTALLIMGVGGWLLRDFANVHDSTIRIETKMDNLYESFKVKMEEHEKKFDKIDDRLTQRFNNNTNN